MLTVVFLAVLFALLALGGVFALMAKNNRRGQSGSPHAAAGGASHGRASGLD